MSMYEARALAPPNDGPPSAQEGQHQRKPPRKRVERARRTPHAAGARAKREAIIAARPHPSKKVSPCATTRRQ
eukprot:245753-Prymnesium_polylepis.1